MPLLQRRTSLGTDVRVQYTVLDSERVRIDRWLRRPKGTTKWQRCPQDEGHTCSPAQLGLEPEDLEVSDE